MVQGEVSDRSLRDGLGSALARSQSATRGAQAALAQGSSRRARAEIVKAIRRSVEKGEDVTYPRIGADVSDPARDLLTRIAAASHPPASLEEGRGCLKGLRASRLQRQMGEIQKRLEGGGEAALIDELLRRKVMLKRRIEALRDASAS